MDSATRKRQAFCRLVPKRVDVVRDKLRILGNCSNKTNYNWNPDTARNLFALLLLEFISTAKLFGIKVSATVDDKDVYTWRG